MMFSGKTVQRWCLRSMSVVLALTLLLGVGLQTSFAEEKIKLVWSEWWDNEWGVENVDWIISSFEEKHPNVEVEKIHTPWPQMFDKLMTLCQSGETPDVMGMEAEWVPAFDRLGVVDNLGTWLEKDPEFRAKFSESSLIPWKGNTKLIWLYAMSYHFAYNVKLFEEKGLEPPTNWQELKEVLKAFRDPDQGRYGLALQFSLTVPSHLALRLFYTPLIQFGGRVLDDEGNAVFNSEAGVRVLEYWKSLIDEDLVYPDPLGTTEMAMYEMMAGDILPLYLTGPWILSVTRESNPDIQIAYCPPFEDVTSGFVASGSGIALSSKSKHPEMAWEFMKHLWSDEVALRMTEVTSIPWATKAAFEAPFIKDNPILRFQPAMITDPASLPKPVLPEANDLYRALGENIQAYFLGQKDAKTALDDAAAYWNEKLAEYK